jgi:hypothetical protein
MKLYSVVFIALLAMALVETSEPTMSVDHTQQAAPGEIILFSIRVDNTTESPCCNSFVRIDTEAMSDDALAAFNIIKGRATLEPTLEPGSSTQALLQLQVNTGTPDDVYDVAISFEGGLGSCEGGCFPFTTTQSFPVTVARKVPSLYYEYDRTVDVVSGTTEDISITILNTGTGEAKDFKINVGGQLDTGVTPSSISSIPSSSSKSATITVNDSHVDAGRYELSLNIAFYDAYFRLYTDTMPLVVHIRPPRPQLTVEAFYDPDSLILEVNNEGGLKAQSIALDADLDGTKVVTQDIDVIASQGTLLIPVTLPSGLSDGSVLTIDATYHDIGGTGYTYDREIFINISEDSGRGTIVLAIVLIGAIIASAAYVVKRKRR